MRAPVPADRPDTTVGVVGPVVIDATGRVVSSVLPGGCRAIAPPVVHVAGKEDRTMGV